MHQVSTASALNSSPWTPPLPPSPPHEQEEAHAPSSTLSSPHTSAPPPPLLRPAAPQAQTPGTGQPRQQQPQTSPTHQNQFGRHAGAGMAQSGDHAWGPSPPQGHDDYNVPAPAHSGYPMNGHGDHDDSRTMDDRYQDTSYDNSHYYNGGQAPHDAYAYGPHEPPMRDNHFSRNSYHEAGAYPGMSPSPARLSRPEFDDIDPHSIADEDDAHDFPPTRDSPGRKRLSKIPVIGAAAVPAGSYSSVGQGGSSQMLNQPGAEKAAWRDMEELERRKRKRNIWIVVAIIAILAVAGGVAGGILGTRKSASSSGKGSSAPGMSSDSDGLNLDSKEIKALMNNKNLHKVFPAMDYTPYKTQYPDCVGDPPSQDNVTMDMAVLSQLTPAVRVYGVDCNQVEMIMTAIDRLKMNDTMKIWLGVWVDGNKTTNERQMSHMYDILDKYPQNHFLGVIVGNEALFRKEVTEAELGSLLSSVRTNLTSKGINLSVSTSDLGSSWTTTLAAASDHVMGNIHPFFAGVPAPAAAGWTYVFWEGNNVAIAPEPTNAKPGAIPRNIISEVGWPSGGGNDCGTTATCTGTTDGSVAGVPEMNQFMSEWICGANANGTMYFWFEAFDEPWKVVYNTPKEQWEDKWGLMGIDRVLKKGVQIPDCGGKTVSLPAM